MAAAPGEAASVSSGERRGHRRAPRPAPPARASSASLRTGPFCPVPPVADRTSVAKSRVQPAGIVEGFQVVEELMGVRSFVMEAPL